MQGDFYTLWPAGTKGHQQFAPERLLSEDPSYVLFNGRFHGLSSDYALQANVGETIRIYFGVGGTNLASSFHVIGEMFDRLYSQGELLSPPARSIQTTLVAPGQAVAMDIHLEVPGKFLLVDHALTRTIDKGALGDLIVSGPENPSIFSGSSGGAEHEHDE